MGICYQEERRMQKKIKENWEKELKQWILEIYNAHEKPHSYGGMENYYVEKIHQFLKFEREKLLEKIDEIIDDNNDLLRWQKEELKDEIEKEL